jgi:glycine cleavage system aminomethyltransferase T
LSYFSDIKLDDNPYVIGMGGFVDFDQPGDFIGKAELQEVAATGPARRLVGIEIDGPALDVPNEDFWDIVVNGETVGRVTRCAHSPRLDRNIGWANVPAALADIGTELQINAPDGMRRAVVCEAPWFKPQVKIPDDMKR